MMPARGRWAVGLAALALGVLTACSPGLDVHVVGADGSNHLKVGSGTLGALSHDGNQVLFSRDGEIAVATRNGGVRLLTNGSSDGAPSWSGDGGRVAFIRDSAPDDEAYEHDVHVMNADGTAPRSLTAGAADDQAPVWSPDGTRIAFFRESEVHVMNADGSGLQRVAQGARAEGAPSWSPDGRRLAYAWSDSSAGALAASGIAVANADGSGVVRITQTGFDANAYRSGDDSPDWSPDGSRVVFARQGTIQVVSPDGSRLTQIGPRGGDPRWSPDGKSIAFCCAGHKKYSGGIFVMGADGSGLRRLHKDGDSPIGSGDGSVIAFEQTG